MKNRRILLTLVLFSVMLLSLFGCSYFVEHTHSYADWESITAPTCSTFGVEKRTCDCGYAEYKTTDALAHTPVTDVKIDATCTSYGKTEGTHCSVCNTVITAQTEINPLAHSFSEWETVVNATCTSFGLEKRTCDCNYAEYKTIGALAHTPVTDAKVDATCTSYGKTEGSHCGVCNTVITAQTEIKPVAHSFSEWETVTEATCTSFGLEKRTCDCNYAEYKTTDALAHNTVTDTAVAVTCTTDGKTEGSHCDSCGTIFVVQSTIPATGHKCDNVTVLTEAVCNVDGQKRFACSNADCSYFYDESYSVPELDTAEIMNQAVQYTGYISMYGRLGELMNSSTAFVIRSDGIIVTCNTVIDNAYSGVFTLGEETYDIVEVLAYSAENEIAVLRVNAKDLPYAQLCTHTTVVSETVYAVGNSRGLSIAINSGIVSNPDAMIGGVSIIQHDTPLLSGYTGSPLINRFGEVIGVNYGHYYDDDFRIAIPIGVLESLSYDNPISIEEYGKQTYTPKEQLIDWVQWYATVEQGTVIAYEFNSSDHSFYLGYNSSNNSLFIEGSIFITENIRSIVQISLDKLYDGTYYYVSVYTDGNYRSDLTGFIDPASYCQTTMLTYDTLEGRYWTDETLLNTASYSAYETLRWFSYHLDTYFYGITLEETFGFSSLSYDRDEYALEKLNLYLQANGVVDPETGAYHMSYSQTANDASATFYYNFVYTPATDLTPSTTTVTIYYEANGQLYGVTITLNPTENGNRFETFYAVLEESSYSIKSSGWGYVDANSLTDTTPLTCYVFTGLEEYQDGILSTCATLIPHLLNCTNYVLSNIETNLTIRDLGFLFYFVA